MRIIAGRYRARKLVKIRGEIRPTPVKIRESLFSILGDDVRGSAWLDLFSGSGVIGIEALSRGAGYVVFNDRDPGALRLIRENLKRCGVTENFEVSRLDAFVLLRDPKRLIRTGRMDYIYLDPPFRFGRYGKLLSKAIVSPLYEAGRTLLLLEVFRKTPVDFIPPELELKRTLKSGDSHLLLIAS